MRVLILGLDNAGKTTILYRLHSGEVHSSPHTNPRKLHFAQPQRAGGHHHSHYRLQRGDSNAQEPSIPSPTIPRRLRLHVPEVTVPAGVGPWRPGLHPPVRHRPLQPSSPPCCILRCFYPLYVITPPSFSYWRCYIPNTNAIIYVIDSTGATSTATVTSPPHPSLITLCLPLPSL